MKHSKPEAPAETNAAGILFPAIGFPLLPLSGAVKRFLSSQP